MMKYCLAIFLLICTGCFHFQSKDENISFPDLAMPRDLVLSAELNRDDRIFHVRLQNISDHPVSEDYYYPNLSLFCVYPDSSVKEWSLSYFIHATYSIPVLQPKEIVTFKVPVECFSVGDLSSLLNDDAGPIIEEGVIFIVYESRYGSICSKAMRIDEPLSLRAETHGSNIIYRAVEF